MEKEYDKINPSHYKNYSVEVIEMMVKIWGEVVTASYCELCAFKYRMRLGCKPDQDIETELGKEKWYLNKRNELIQRVNENEV